MTKINVKTMYKVVKPKKKTLTKIEEKISSDIGEKHGKTPFFEPVI